MSGSLRRTAPDLETFSLEQPRATHLCQKGELEASVATTIERQPFVVAALFAANPEEPTGQDAALWEGVTLDLDELRQVGPGGYLCLGEEGGGVLLHQAVQLGQFRTVTL